MRALNPLPVAEPRVVSSGKENLILVDADDRVLGCDSKHNIHRQGLLHRAFSIFLFAGPGRVLLHRRSLDKPLWPGYWTNSCCSHPRWGESYLEAAHRRLDDELGVSAKLSWLYQFRYRAQYRQDGWEHELCAVLLGNVDEYLTLQPHPREVMAWGWFDCDEVDRWVACAGNRFTPWFKLEWTRLRGGLSGVVEALCSAPGD